MKLISITSLPETTELNGTEVLLGDQNDLTRGIPLSQIIAAVSVSASDVPIATTTIAGRVKPDGSTVSVAGDGTLSVNTYNLVPKTTTINSKPLTGNISLSATDVGLGNVSNVNTTNPANITQSANYRFVTDTEKITWNSKQNALGFVPVANTTTINSKPLSGNISLNASDIGLGNVTNVDTTNPANITQSTNYRFVSDSEKTTWNNKQSALGFVPVSNTTTINNHPLSGNINLAASDVGLGNVQNVDTTNAVNITSGTLSASRLPVASTTSLGAVKVDGSTITINNGVISSIVSSGGVIDTSSFVNKSLTINSHPLSGNISLNASDIGLGNVSNVDATNPANITQSTNYRFVSDSEKTTWNNKQSALGFVPVPNTTTINNKPISGNITLSSSDVSGVGLDGFTSSIQTQINNIVSSNPILYAKTLADFTSALTTANTSGGATIIVGGGTFSGVFNIPANTNIIGSGKGFTIFKLPNTTSGNVFTFLTGKHNGSISNCTIDGNKANQTNTTTSNNYGILSYYANDISINNVEVKNTNGIGIGVHTGVRNTVSKCYVHDTLQATDRASAQGMVGIWFGSDTTNNLNSVVEDCICEYCGLDGIIIGANGVTVNGGHYNYNGWGMPQPGVGGAGIYTNENGVSDVVINSAQCRYNTGIGLDIPSASNITITNCFAEYNNNAGIGLFNVKGGTLTGNTVSNNGQNAQVDAQDAGIVISGDVSSTGITAIGNTSFDNQGTKTQKYGILVTGNVNNAIVVSNSAYGNTIDIDTSGVTGSSNTFTYAQTSSFIDDGSW